MKDRQPIRLPKIAKAFVALGLISTAAAGAHELTHSSDHTNEEHVSTCDLNYAFKPDMEIEDRITEDEFKNLTLDLIDFSQKEHAGPFGDGTWIYPLFSSKTLRLQSFEDETILQLDDRVVEFSISNPPTETFDHIFSGGMVDGQEENSTPHFEWDEKKPPKILSEEEMATFLKDVIEDFNDRPIQQCARDFRASLA